MVPRLPDGSEFSARYDARLVLWTGHLRIYGHNGLEMQTFHLSHPGVFGLMRRLDKLYRDYLAKRDGKGLANGKR